MSFRTTIIVAIILIGVGLYAYFGEYKGSAKKQEKQEQAKLLMEVKKEDVAEIRIDGLGKPVRIVPVSQDVWQLTSPIQTRADESTVNRILGDFEKLKYKDVVEEKPNDLTAYDLKNPKIVVRLGFKKGKPERTVMIGAKNPVNDIYYVRLNNDPRVYAVESTIGDVATTTLLDLRDKKLTDFSSEKVNTLGLKTQKQDLEFQKQSGIWKMKKPVDSPASDTEITSLLSSLETLRASEFIDEASPDPAKYGLQNPAAEVTLVLEKGLQQKVQFGKKDGEQIYCRVEGNPGIAKVSDSFTSIFDKKLDDWREKKLLIFNRFDTEQVHFKTAGKEYVFSKDKQEKWIEQQPSKGEVDTDKIQGILEKLENADINKYGDAPNFQGAPLVEIYLTMRDWQEKVTVKHLAFGPLQDKQQAVKNDDYNTIVFVDVGLQQDIEKALGAIKTKTQAPAKKK